MTSAKTIIVQIVAQTAREPRSILIIKTTFAVSPSVRIFIHQYRSNVRTKGNNLMLLGGMQYLG